MIKWEDACYETIKIKVNPVIQIKSCSIKSKFEIVALKHCILLCVWPPKKLKDKAQKSKKVTADEIEFGKREASILLQQFLSHISKLALYRLCHIL